jgi:homoserine O-succinyltransferase
MPTKVETETQLLRLLGSSPLYVEPIFLRTGTHQSRHVAEEHLERFYTTLEGMTNESFDGMIITGAPVEHLAFEEVDYWEELQEVMDFAITNARSSLYICWGAQAALYHHFGIPKYPLAHKMFGIFRHTLHHSDLPLFRGFDDEFFAPHSRHTEIRREDLIKVSELEILAESDQAGVYMVGTRDGRRIFVTGHSEYDPLTLQGEYERDRGRGLPIAVPENYFLDDDPLKPPVVRWRGHAHLLFANWLRWYVNVGKE